jgi:hypothetical protein
MRGSEARSPHSRPSCLVLDQVPLDLHIMSTPWAFWAMMSQLPLIMSSPLLRRMGFVFNNSLFWISFCFVGQPVARRGHVRQGCHCSLGISLTVAYWWAGRVHTLCIIRYCVSIS